MASRSTARQSEPTSTVRKKTPFVMKKLSRTVRLVKGVTISPLTQALVYECTNVGGLCCIQVEVAEEGRDKKTFASHGGLYCFIRMIFGFMNEPATFL